MICIILFQLLPKQSSKIKIRQKKKSQQQIEKKTIVLKDLIKISRLHKLHPEKTFTKDFNKFVSFHKNTLIIIGIELECL